MGWWILFLACIFEIIWAVAMKYSHGFERLWPTVITLVCALISFILMAVAEKTLPLSTAYIVLNGVGAAGVVICGFLLFNESANPFRLLCVLLIVIGIIGLRATTHDERNPKTGTAIESSESLS